MDYIQSCLNGFAGADKFIINQIVSQIMKDIDLIQYFHFDEPKIIL